MDFGAVGINADLHLFDVELAKALGLFFTNQYGVGLELDVEAQLAGMFDDFETIGPDQRLAATDREEENACGGELIEQRFNFGGVHFAVAVVIEVTVLAALIAPIGDVEMHAKRDAAAQCSAD